MTERTTTRVRRWHRMDAQSFSVTFGDGSVRSGGPITIETPRLVGVSMG